jgi:hypothetical protein
MIVSTTYRLKGLDQLAQGKEELIMKKLIKEFLGSFKMGLRGVIFLGLTG